MKNFTLSSLLFIFCFSYSLCSKYEDCEKPPEVEHGLVLVSFDENEEYVKATYRCNDGYRLRGNSEITCDLDTDEWEQESPNCVEDTASSNNKSPLDNKKRRRNRVQEIQEESQITNDFAQHLDLSCMSKGLVKAPQIKNAYLKYNRRRKGEKLFLVAYYECDDGYELEDSEHDRLYCSRESWVGNTPVCIPQSDIETEYEENDEDYEDENGNVSGGESENESENESGREDEDNEVTSESHHEDHNEIEKATTEASTEPPKNVTMPCDSDRAGCDHECQMVRYDFDPEPVVQCSCYKGFVLDEYDGRRCHDINECDSDHGCEQICNNLPGSFECACHPGLQIDSTNNKNCIDINECSRNNGRGECQDVCYNTEGSYKCSCERLPNTRLASDGHSCVDAGECSNNNGNCSHICLWTMKKIFCLCPEGLELGEDEKTCLDINECLENPSICGANVCENSYGTYTCIEPSTTQPSTTAAVLFSTTELSHETKREDENISDVVEVEYNEINKEKDENDDEEDDYFEERLESGKSESEIEKVDLDEDNDATVVSQHEKSDVHNEISEAESTSPHVSEVMETSTISTIASTSTTTEMNNEIPNEVENENDSIEDPNEDEQYSDVDEEEENERSTDLHHQSSTVKSDFGSECDDGLRLDSDGKCVEINEREQDLTTLATTTEVTHASRIKPECQHVDGEGVECYCPYGYDLSEDESFCEDINECEIYDNDYEDESNNDDGDDVPIARPKATFCSHTCTNLIGSFICSCPENFHIHDDKRTCVRDYCADLSNSELNKTKCSHECIDRQEGYSCECPNGFTLQNDLKTCKEDFVEEIGEVEKETESDSEEEFESIVECSSTHHEHCSPGNCVVVGDELACSCPSGYATKSKSCVDIDECEYGSHQCSHSCHNTEGSYRCSCPNGLTLSDDEKTCDDLDECSHDDDICGSLECRNTYGSYKCICQEGEEIDEHGECRAVNLCYRNNGECSHSCRSHHDQIICECPEDMELDDDKKTCIDFDPCRYENGGCSHYCEKNRGPICFCPPGFVLDDETETTCKEEFKCKNGFKLLSHESETCVDIDECSEHHNVCLNGHCENTEGSYRCHCHSGYELSQHNITCVDIDECAREMSRCSHRCLNLPGSYQCGCPYGQVLIEDGHTCGFSDLCDFNNGGCAHECDFVDNKISCSCRKGYKVDDDDDKNCVDVDECQEDNGGCEQSCINMEGTHQCSCHVGYELKANGLSCADVDECVENNGDCSNICINLIGSHSCACEAGYSLGHDNHTCFDVDECQDIHDCSHICINTEGTYECACPNGFLLAHDKFNCHDIDECLDSPCIDGHCNNTIGSFHCYCQEGFELLDNGISCIDIDECVRLSHSCSHHCLNFAGGYNCSCPSGMELNDNSQTCEDINECEMEQPCSHECENTEGSFICKCPKGFVLDDNGKDCIDLDECLTDNHECSEVCTNTKGSYHCSCSSGKLLSSDGKSCNEIDPCSIDNGGCSQVCEYRHNQIVCSCRNGFEIDINDKTLCNDIDECKRDSICQQQCVNTIGSYKCECFPGFRFNENDQCIDIDECKTSGFRCPNTAQCINTAGSYKCVCPDGSKLSRDKAHCIEIKNECKPLTIKHGDVRCTRSRHRTQLFYRTKCAISCDKGYKLHGPSIKHCNGTGYWDDNGDPICVPLACPRLAKPDHGTILPANCMYGETFSGERCFLHCPSGYKALGKRVAVCNNKLEWQPKAELQCVPVRIPSVQLTSQKYHHHQQQQQHNRHQQHPRPSIKCPEDMNVIKPKNQETILVRIPMPETNVDWNMYVDAQPVWAKRLEGALSLGATEVTFRAGSPYSNEFDICRLIINVVDPSPPTVTFCPEPFIVQLNAHETARPVYWDEATFESKHPIQQIFKSKVPGHRFGPGVHPITYIATNKEGLSAKCTFRITVKAHETPFDHSQRIALETNTITDSYEAPAKHLENHDSYLICSGKPPIKIDSNQPWHLPHGCVIKNVKAHRSRHHQQRPLRRERPLRKQHQISQQTHEGASSSRIENPLVPTPHRRSNRLRYYSSWDTQRQQQYRQQHQQQVQNRRHHQLRQHPQNVQHRQHPQHIQHQQYQNQRQYHHHTTQKSLRLNHDSLPVAYWD
ncbi:CLUMA_CG008282, isoform A [Clunio marinus]|uniref:CLUMA_CG008282, isoform A n=1 Tax=Clunio marinus TaxID=568069 RepID=A0A1J1I5C3_9DIPT|nr:CLUMA_CG008282, isoform A [Clunio marinus]